MIVDLCEHVAMNVFGGIEAGGTKFICAVGSGKGEILTQKTIQTDTADKTLTEVIDFFNTNKVESIGIGSFGPVDVDPQSENYGLILNTPKPGWSNVNIKKILENELGTQIGLVTDTDVAAIGEQFYGKAIKANSVVYITIGTGVGGTVIVSRDIVHGISHPELGHMSVPISRESTLQNTCSYHDFCLEGFVSGKSIEIITGKKAETIYDDALWDEIALIISRGVFNIITILQPEVIILGGSVLKAPRMIARIQEQVMHQINGYFDIPKVEEYIVHNSSDTIGVLGAIKLGSDTAKSLSQ